MSDPQNLNQTSPGNLSTGAPPQTEQSLPPKPETPSTAAGAPAPPSTSDGTTVSSVAPMAASSDTGPAPGAAGRASTGAPAQPAGAGLEQGSNIINIINSGGGGGSGSDPFNVVTETTTYLARFNDCVLADPTAATFAVNLPQAAGGISQNAIIIKNISPGSNPVTVVAHAGDTIDGASSIDLYSGEYVYIISNAGTEWFVVSERVASGGISFSRVINQPADGQSFVVNMPTPQKDANYQVVATLADAAVDVVITVPKVTRTASQFVCVTSLALNSGDSIDFEVSEGVSEPSGVAFRLSSPIPITGPSGPVGVNRVYSSPMYFPSDVVNTTVNGCNRTYAAGAGADVVSDFAMYQSDGLEQPTGASLGTLLAKTIKGDGTIGLIGTFPTLRGTDGKCVVLYSFPDPVFDHVAVTWGDFAPGTLVVDPAPALAGGASIDVPFWFTYDISTTKRRFIVLTDSIGVGYSVGSPVGFSAASWNNVAASQDWAVDIEGVVNQGSLQNFANVGGLPFLWDQITDIAPGVPFVIQLGTNDLAANNLLTMQNALQALLVQIVAVGGGPIYAWTIPPQTSFPAANAVRLAYNAWLLANFGALGITAVYDAAAAQLAGGLAANGNPNALFAAYDSGDGTHLSVAGQSALAAGWLTIV